MKTAGLKKNSEPDFSALKPGDSTTACTAYNLTLDSLFDLNAPCDFELRFWQLPLMTSSHEGIVLRYTNKQWKAQLFVPVIANNTISFTEKPINQHKLRQLWYRLQQQQILTLPDQGALKNVLVKYVIDPETLQENRQVMTFTDGIGYAVYLKTPQARRSYFYGNPIPLQQYYPNVEPLYHAAMMVLLFQKYRQLPFDE